MINNLKLSLADLLGEAYIDAVAAAQSALTGTSAAAIAAEGREKVEFYPDAFAAGQLALLESVGRIVAPGLAAGKSCAGAATIPFAAAHNRNASPLAARGVYRLGEDGKLYLAAKSEHYQASLGHAFPGYELLHRAARLGITNITHNNTRGFITRHLERELVRVANGVAPGDERAIDALLAADDPTTLDRVINLETGSLVMEAAVKMMLARFHPVSGKETPLYAGKTPVFLVMADHRGGLEANYHGTTVATQMLRGLWPELRGGGEHAALFQVAPVKINDLDDFNRQVAHFDAGKYKIAGFLHEIILMNYGAIRLNADYLRSAYAICREHDIPVAVDEIQSCMWSPEIFLFKEYGLRPDFVSVGKGFPGGMYPASRLITNRRMDNLNLFGALVTNGQEEIASLSCLITLAFAEANREHNRRMSARYAAKLEALAAAHPEIIREVVGCGLMLGLTFASPETAARFAEIMNRDCCVDVGCQTYKANCPPTALTKLPLTVAAEMIDFIVERMADTLRKLG
jgi:4-aminobutyrate aminotransferase-like enzyme